MYIYFYKKTIGIPKFEQDITKHLPVPPCLEEPIGPQRIIFELRSESGMPLEAPLQISQITLYHNNKNLCEYTLPNMYESPIHFYAQHAPFQTPSSIDIRKHGAVFFNGYIIFDIPTAVSLKSLSLALTYRSPKNVAVNVFLLAALKENYFGQIQVTKPYHWQNTRLIPTSTPQSHTEQHAHTGQHTSYEDIVINKVCCINNEGEMLSTVSTEDSISIEIEYTATNKSLFENTQIFIVLRNKQTTKEHIIFTQNLRFNPLIATHTIITPINTDLIPGEYDIVVFLAKQMYKQTSIVSILTLDQDSYHLIQNPLSIKVVEPLEAEITKNLESQSSEISVFYYN